MKMRHAVLVSAAVLVGWSGSALGAQDVANTKHNLSTGAPGTNSFVATAGFGSDRICVFCHTPHFANDTVGVALWNRTTQTGSFTMYSSDTIDMDIDAQPTGVSLACLSCHDGQTAFDALLNFPGAGLAEGTPAFTFTADNLSTSANGNIGLDLSNDHPISVTYDNTTGTGDPQFNAAGTLTTAQLYDGKVQCPSCHDPHEADIATFLRNDNAGSSLCLECHIK
jgi:predicted CXXCH cytochrome family protein